MPDDIYTTPSDSVYAYQAESSTESLWRHTAELAEPTAYPVLEGQVEADVAIVGGGITGFTTALLLQRAGKKVSVIDALRVGHGVSGFNSGHLTSYLLDFEFQTIISNFGEEATRDVALALHRCIDEIERNVHDYQIDCEFRRVTGYLYAEKSEHVNDLQKEFHAGQKTGLPINRSHRAPLPFDIADAFSIERQAIINPMKYVQGLAEQFRAEGGLIFEASPVKGIHSEGSGFMVETERGWIDADEVVVATHTPIGFRPAVQTRLEPLRSYVIGIRTDELPEDALFWDMENPYHYIRLGEDEQGKLVIIGGEDHHTGEGGESEAFERLEAYAREHFNVLSVDYRWSAQLYDPVDGLPYIGKIGGTYVATGFSGEGLTFGTLAGRIICDDILGSPNELADILSPTRTKPVASAVEFVKDNAKVMGHMIGDRLKPGLSKHELDAIPAGEGCLMQCGGKKVAAYKDGAGEVHTMSAVCTHLGCIVNWNGVEKSWDCPCHGARFDALGSVLNGPATRDLEPLD